MLALKTLWLVLPILPMALAGPIIETPSSIVASIGLNQEPLPSTEVSAPALITAPHTTWMATPAPQPTKKGPEAMLSISMVVPADAITDFRKYWSKHRNADNNSICGFWNKDGKKVEKTRLATLYAAATLGGVTARPNTFVYASADEKTGDKAYTFYYDICTDEESFKDARFECKFRASWKPEDAGSVEKMILEQNGFAQVGHSKANVTVECSKLDKPVSFS